MIVFVCILMSYVSVQIANKKSDYAIVQRTKKYLKYNKAENLLCNFYKD